MAKNIEELEEIISEYEKRMGIGESDPAKDGYLVLVKILRQQNEYLNTINIKEMVVKEDKTKATAEYERAKGLWEKLPDMIRSVKDLRFELKMDGEQKQAIQKPISPQSLGKVI